MFFGGFGGNGTNTLFGRCLLDPTKRGGQQMMEMRKKIPRYGAAISGNVETHKKMYIERLFSLCVCNYGGTFLPSIDVYTMMCWEGVENESRVD